jgi:hypothetical protein
MTRSGAVLLLARRLPDYVELMYDSGVVDEREVRRTRTAYVAAANRLIRAMERLRSVAPPLLPDESDPSSIPPWTAVDEEAMRACASGFTEVVRLHSTFGRMVRAPDGH